jgi:hypothetical protein
MLTAERAKRTRWQPQFDAIWHFIAPQSRPMKIGIINVWFPMWNPQTIGGPMNVQRGDRVRLVPNFAEHLMKWLDKGGVLTSTRVMHG